jgi:hypothetical protein
MFQEWDDPVGQDAGGQRQVAAHVAGQRVEHLAVLADPD